MNDLGAWVIVVGGFGFLGWLLFDTFLGGAVAGVVIMILANR